MSLEEICGSNYRLLNFCRLLILLSESNSAFNYPPIPIGELTVISFSYRIIKELGKKSCAQISQLNKDRVCIFLGEKAVLFSLNSILIVFFFFSCSN